MQELDLFHFLAFLIPMLTSVFMLTLLGLDISSNNRHNRKPKIWLFWYFLFWMFIFFLLICRFTMSHIFLYFNWLYHLSIISTPIFFYHFIFEITQTQRHEQFSQWHYVVPVITVLIMITMLFITPYEEQFQILINHSRYPYVYSFFEIVSNSKEGISLMIKIIYITLCFKRLRHYDNFITNYSSNKSRTSLRQAYRFLWILILSFILSMLRVSLSQDVLLTSYLISCLLFILAFSHVYLVSHVMKEYYTLFDSEFYFDIDHLQEPAGVLKKSILTKTFFEDYIHTQRPYLNPNLKITDLVNELQLNRTYISGFINREYNMNFSKYINQCRLNEYRQICTDPILSKKSPKELYTLAGFNNYRYFQRLVKEQSRGALDTNKNSFSADQNID